MSYGGTSHSQPSVSVKTAGGAPATGGADSWLNAERSRDEQHDRERDIEAAGGPYRDGDKDYGAGSGERRGSALLFEGTAYTGPHTDALRKGFLRKVYGVLTAQMVLTVAVCAFAMLNASAQAFAVAHGGGLMVASAVVSIVLLISLYCFKHHHPHNLYLLSGFTFAVAIELGVVCAVYQHFGAGDTILLAAALTLAVFVGLTLFTHQSTYDFSFLGAGLGVCLWVLLLWGLVNMLFGFRAQFLYSLFGAVVFSLFVVFDTYMICHRYGYDDWAEASVELYLDIVNLFLYILQLLSKFTRDT